MKSLAGRQFAQVALLLLAACSGEQQPPEQVQVLVRVGSGEISAADFATALERLDPAGQRQALTLEQWRSRLQPLIDRQLLVLEAGHLGLDRPETGLARTAAAQSRAWLISRLLERRGDLGWDEAELQEFFKAQSAEREIRVSRLVLGDSDLAAAALERARKGESLQQLAAAFGGAGSADLGWLNPLASGDTRASVLFALEPGAVELIEGDGVFLLFAVTDQRQVTLEQRRSLVAKALGQKKQSAANMAYLADLTERYQVRLDTAALGQLRSAGAAGVQPQMRLLRSTLGDWTVGDYLQTVGQLAAPLSQTGAALGFQVTRAYIVEDLLEREAAAAGLADSLEIQRQKALENLLIEALFTRQAGGRVEISAAELAAFYQANKARYDELRHNMDKAVWRNRLEKDLREGKAAPLFETYLVDLRRRRADQVVVDEERLSEFIARQRRVEVPF